jgi:two-component system, chemotaxis family, chemotaxis protein CheY
MTPIVFCEDDPTIQKLIRVALRTTPYDVYVAADGLAGLALIERVEPEAVFADVAMPGLDGLQLVSALKTRPHLAPIPVVLLTALVQRQHREEVDRQGVAGYLTKPFSPAELRASVDAFAGMVA